MNLNNQITRHSRLAASQFILSLSKDGNDASLCLEYLG